MYSAFALIKNGNNKKIIYGTIILGLIYITLYLRAESYNRLIIEQEMNFKLVFYFLIFTFGIFLASVESKIKYQGVVDYLMLLLFILVIYGHKLLVMMTGRQLLRISVRTTNGNLSSGLLFPEDFAVGPGGKAVQHRNVGRAICFVGGGDDFGAIHRTRASQRFDAALSRWFSWQRDSLFTICFYYRVCVA
jgi:hypothetical protein